MQARRPAACLCFLVLCIALRALAQAGAPWPEADKLFHSDPLWLGSDAGFSVDLGNGRVLWMFNDTFVARNAGDDRRHSAFVRNTIAIQSGYDPSRATIRLYWKTRKGEPSEVFPSQGSVWMWPGSGIRVGKRLLLFCERVASDSSRNSLGFKSAGWNAYWITNPEDDPSVWKMKIAERSADSVTMASQVLRDKNWVYFFGQGDPENNLYMARIGIDTLAKGKLGAMQWWSSDGWQVDKSKRTALLLDAGTETSIQPDASGAGFIEVNSRGFGATDIVMRRASRLTGPWSLPVMIYRPPESDAPEAFVYAGKAHAELKGADLVVTYATNGPDDKVARDMALYFPRFVRVSLHSEQRSGEK